jgi:hypothetical protein
MYYDGSFYIMRLTFILDAMFTVFIRIVYRLSNVYNKRIVIIETTILWWVVRNKERERKRNVYRRRIF